MTRQKKVLFIGEAMLELVQKSENLLAKSFAGDVFNTSVYIKRSYSDLQVSFLSALGQDPLSQEFSARVKAENIDTDYLAISKNKHLGTYMVVNDKSGERSFIYWRNDSAAKSMMSLLSQNQLEDLRNNIDKGDTVFFSGITLAILLPAERDSLFQVLEELKERGADVVFDPNYRPALWESQELAKENIEKAFSLSQILMPGIDDFASLYGFNTAKECIEFCQQYPFSELVLKQGSNSVHVVNASGHQEIDIVKSTKVVDTTSAGDAFNGIYLGARLTGESELTATKLANYAASKVIETPGAIMPFALFKEKWSQKPRF